jgi:hypothetical protein
VNLAEALTAQRNVKRGQACSVGVFVAGLKPDEAATFEAALGEARIRKLEWAALSRALEAAGYEKSAATKAGTLSRHGRGVCECA